MRFLLGLVLLVTLGGVADAGRAQPKIRSKSAVVLDAASGEVVWGKEADEERDIASMTKIFIALTLRKHDLDLDAWSTIGDADVEASDGGARTRLPRGQTFRNHDLLRAMLMVSDNRAPTAMARSVGLDTDELIAEMNQTAADLGLTHTRFVDTTGIHGNTSTAHELAIALAATLDDPVLAKIMTTKHVRIVSKNKKVKVDYRHTVQALHDGKYKVFGAKSGHTDTAGYCFMMKAKIGSRIYVMAFLGGAKRKTRYFDFEKVARWLLDQQWEEHLAAKKKRKKLAEGEEE